MGAGATIAIVDSGVDMTHPDLRDRLLPGANFTSGESCDPGTQDLNGHGTHVAGIAAASANNGIGVAGTAPLASILPVRVLDKNGAGNSTDIAAGIAFAAAHAKVINLSLGDVSIGGTGLGDPLGASGVSTAIESAHSAGATVVIAAGDATYPLCSNAVVAQDAICVAATDSTGFPSSFSNFPVNPGGTAVRAPGGDRSGCGDGDIWSTYLGGVAGDSCGAHGYEPLGGTSMAGAFVSGVAAILSAAGLDNTAIASCIRQTSSNGGSYDPVNGYGIVNAQAAVSTCAHLTQPLPTADGSPTDGTQQTSTGTTPTSGQTGSGGAEGDQASDTTAPTIRVAIPNDKRAHAARRGSVTVRVRISESAKVALKIMSGRETAIAGRNSVLMAQGLFKLGAGTHNVKLRLGAAGKRIMRRHRTQTVTLLALARDAASNDGTAISEGKIRR